MGRGGSGAGLKTLAWCWCALDELLDCPAVWLSQVDELLDCPAVWLSQVKKGKNYWKNEIGGEISAWAHWMGGYVKEKNGRSPWIGVLVRWMNGWASKKHSQTRVLRSG